jgi:hypothetical protein
MKTVKKTKASLKKTAKKAAKKVIKKIAAKPMEFGKVSSYAGTGARYWESVKFPGFRIRKAEDGTLRIHIARKLEPNLRYRKDYIALDVPRSVMKGILSRV